MAWHAGIRGVSSFHLAVGGTCILTLPTLFIHSFKKLSWLNMIGFISTMVVTATMVVLVAVDPFRDHMPTQVCSLGTLASLLLHAATLPALPWHVYLLLSSITSLDHPTQGRH